MKTPLTEYEKVFIEKCKEFRLRLKKDEDGSPVVWPRGKKKKKLFHVGAWGPSLCYLCITATHGKTMKKLVTKLKDTKVLFSFLTKGDCECILSFALDDLKKVCVKFNLVKSVDKKLLSK